MNNFDIRLFLHFPVRSKPQRISGWYYSPSFSNPSYLQTNHKTAPLGRKPAHLGGTKSQRRKATIVQMNDVDARHLPDPAQTNPVSESARKQAAELLDATPDYFDLDPDQRGSAKAAIARAIQLDPHNGSAWYCIGIHLKLQRRWEEAALCNRRAVELLELGDASEGEPVFWNLGIASTALRDWEAAHAAWSRYGIQLPGGFSAEGNGFGSSPVRIFGDDYVEVVWGERICPARIRIENVPMPASGHRWGDIVLHDGVPNGSRTFSGQEFTVFDELERWEESPTVTLESIVRAETEDIDDLIFAFSEAGAAAQDWTSTIRMLCRACSEGSPDEQAHSHDHDVTTEGSTIGIAASKELATQILDQWVSQGSGRHRSDILIAERPTPHDL